MRHVGWAGLVLLIGAGPLGAAEVTGQIKAVDADKGILTVTVNDKDQEFQIPADLTIHVAEAVANRVAKDGLKDRDVKKGHGAKITTETKDGKEVVTKLLILTGRRADG